MIVSSEPASGSPWLAFVTEDAEGGSLASALDKGAVGIMALVDGPRQVTRLCARLAVAEAETGIPDGSSFIAALVATAEGVLTLPHFGRPSPRLIALGIDTSSLAASLGYPVPESAPVLRTAVGLTVLAAHASGLPPFAALRSKSALELEMARLDGFAAVLLPTEGGISV